MYLLIYPLWNHPWAELQLGEHVHFGLATVARLREERRPIGCASPPSPNHAVLLHNFMDTNSHDSD